MLKPSQRIKEIAESKEMDFADRGQITGYINAILVYLDETHEQKVAGECPTHDNGKGTITNHGLISDGEIITCTTVNVDSLKNTSCTVSNCPTCRTHGGYNPIHA